MADVGVAASGEIVDGGAASVSGAARACASWSSRRCCACSSDPPTPRSSRGDAAWQARTSMLIVGVNGVGKTTTIGKLANQLRQEGRTPLICAADTFRAAAVDQLQIWADRAGVDIVRAKEGSDPAAVVFDAMTAARRGSATSCWSIPPAGCTRART